MSFTLEDFSSRRPHLYHLTDRRNIRRITATGTLESAAQLLTRASDRDAIRIRRPLSRAALVDGEAAHIRDQAPLHAGAMELERGWEFGDFVAHLNERVFFWPGTERGPISYGVRHF